MRYLSELLSSVFIRQEQQPEGAGDGSLAELCDALLSQSGEMSGNRLARGVLNRFAAAGSEEQIAFFLMLADRFDIDAEHAVGAAQLYAREKNADNLSVLMECVEPRRQELFRRLNQVPGATNELVQMRALLLEACREHPALRRIDVDFQHLFRSWFNQGFLVLREIDWHSPANILEKIIAYEAVHAINSWTALRSRLEPDDRRCFAFFHPAMLDEPLIFVEVALTRSSPASIRDVLSTHRDILPAANATVAVFYSISNCQSGLAGVSFGNFLIKQVARELSRELPGLETFRTLSPVPGFMRWVNSVDDQSAEGIGESDGMHSRIVQALETARRVSTQDTIELHADEAEQLQFLVAYFLRDRKREDNWPLDPVARFHLGNGASLDHVLPAADVYKKGLAQSAGVMVSYLYDLDRVEDNHEAYANDQTVIVSSEVSALLDKTRRVRKRA
ncbi:MAG: decarboxylase [Granulosicoccus sp.]|nr:decarboxylase [Granulosicoccus sp.]